MSSNEDIGAIFEEMATLLELTGANGFGNRQRFGVIMLNGEAENTSSAGNIPADL